MKEVNYFSKDKINWRDQIVGELPEELKEKICPDCRGEIAIRNPTGKCDHLYYPDNKPKKLDFEVGEEIPTPKHVWKKCPKCKKEALECTNGSHSYGGFLPPDHPNVATNRFKCSNCDSKFKVIIK